MAGHGDLVGGRYPLGYTFSKLLGQKAQGAQGNLAPRSSLEFVGVATTDEAAALVSGEMTLVAVPVEIGDVFSTVGIAVGATAAGTPTHSWGAVYDASGTLLEQSTDGTTAAIAASGLFEFTLSSSVLVLEAQAPEGFLYVGVSVTATTVPSVCSKPVATAVQYARFTNASAFLAGTDGSALGATAPSSVTLANVTALAYVPEVYLY